MAEELKNLIVDGEFRLFDVLEFFYRDQGYDLDTAFDKTEEMIKTIGGVK